MPIYVYRCEKCQNEVELMQKVNDPAPAKCDACGVAEPLTRQVSRTSFVLKGGGWYNDLYASAKKDGSSTKDASSSSASTPAASTGTSSTPASAPSSASSSTSTPASSSSGSSSTGSGGSGTSGT